MLSVFFSSKCSLFHNANFFGACIIHILYTGCAEIKKNNSGARRLNVVLPLRSQWLMCQHKHICSLCMCELYKKCCLLNVLLLSKLKCVECIKSNLSLKIVILKPNLLPIQLCCLGQPQHSLPPSTFLSCAPAAMT